ncbi:hypothetical protein [Synechococcus sp. M16CYN]|uniref:hypothetical protein n=1 Tax=Synechococcus sp. M16CYN TaxID=3103139 RepID=UPI003340E5BA
MEERYERYRPERPHDLRDRFLHRWLGTGRQLIDGFAGRRPGQRRPRLNLDSFGRWVGGKVDWLLEEEDGWREPWQEASPRPLSRAKRPLQAISRRSQRRKSDSSVLLAPSTSLSFDDWPDEELFRLQRQQRALGQRSPSGVKSQVLPPFFQRGLPRSSRRST